MDVLRSGWTNVYLWTTGQETIGVNKYTRIAVNVQFSNNSSYRLVDINGVSAVVTRKRERERERERRRYRQLEVDIVSVLGNRLGMCELGVFWQLLSARHNWVGYKSPQWFQMILPEVARILHYRLVLVCYSISWSICDVFSDNRWLWRVLGGTVKRG